MFQGPGSNLPNMSLQKMGMPAPVISASSPRTRSSTLTVAPIKRDSTHVEYACNSDIRTKADQIDSYAKEDRDPNREDRSAGQRQDLGPNVGEWDESIAREGENRSAKCLHCGEGDELEDDEGANGESNSTTFAKYIVEDLSHGLVQR